MQLNGTCIYRDTEDLSTKQSPLLEDLDEGQYGLVRSQLHQGVVNTHNVFYSHRVLNVGRENSQIGTETSNNTSVSQRIVIYNLWSLVRTQVMT